MDLMDLARSRLDGEEVRGLWPRGRVPDPGQGEGVAALEGIREELGFQNFLYDLGWSGFGPLGREVSRG